MRVKSQVSHKKQGYVGKMLPPTLEEVLTKARAPIQVNLSLTPFGASGFYLLSFRKPVLIPQLLPGAPSSSAGFIFIVTIWAKTQNMVLILQVFRKHPKAASSQPQPSLSRLEKSYFCSTFAVLGLPTDHRNVTP